MPRRSRAGYDYQPRRLQRTAPDEAVRLKQVQSSGVWVVCRRCGARDRVMPSELRRDEARCQACGGRVDRAAREG